MKALIEKLKGQLEVLTTGLRWYEDNHPEIWNGSDDEALADTEALIKEAEEAMAWHLLPLDDHLKHILGMICFQCVPFAKILRVDGHDIPHKAEAEQAHVIHWLLGHYLKAGNDWAKSAEAEVTEMKVRYQLKQEKSK